MSRRDYPSSTNTLEPGWIRPSDWISMPDPTGSEKWYGILAIYQDSPNYISLKFVGAYHVDWGDGNSQDVASNTQVDHAYNWSDISSGTLCSRGYRQALVTVTPQAGQHITQVNMVMRHGSAPPFANHPALWLDVSMAGTNISSLTLGNSSNSGLVRFPLLERVQIRGATALTGYSNIFGSLPALQNVNDDLDWTGVSSASSMFINCFSLKVAPVCDMSAGSVTDCTSMFYSCYNLVRVPYINAPNATTLTTMFQYCGSLKDIVLKAPAATTITQMFSTCYSLVDASNVSVWAAVTANNVFESCYSLQILPTIAGVTRFSAATNLSYMFNGAFSLKKVSLAGGGASCSFSHVFDGCPSLAQAAIELPTSGTSTLIYAFNNDVALTTVDITSAGAGISSMQHTFDSCQRLESVRSLSSVAACTDFQSTFQSCWALKTAPAMTTTAATLMGAMFSNCHSLRNAPTLDLNGVTSANNMFSNCHAIVTIPAYDLSTVTNMSQMTSNMTGISRVLATGMTTTHAWQNMTLSVTALNEIYANLGISAGQTITVTGSTGAVTTSITSCGTTSGSAVVTKSSTAGLATGMFVTGTGLTGTRSVTFTDAGDTVGLTAHGLTNGKTISFQTITTTTGIIAKTIYYVVNAATDTFQVSATNGGSPLALTTNGSGTMLVVPKINSIITNTSFTLDAPCTANGTVTLSAFTDGRDVAMLKGWTVAG